MLRWKNFLETDSARMLPQEFLMEWDVTHAELAELVGVTVDAVDSWMSGRRVPSEPVKRLLAEIHARWLGYEVEPKEQREIYNRKPRRRPLQEDSD